MSRFSSDSPHRVTPQTNRHRSQRSRLRQGFTLIEVLIATAVTLLMMVALAKIFKDIGSSMKQGRATLELNNRLRDVSHRIRRDLQNLTATPNPPANAASGTGYLKYYDGPQTDYSTTAFVTARNSDADATNDVPNSTRIGDVDDIFMGTARAGDIWFTGKVPRFILEGRAPTTNDLDSNNRLDDLEDLVSIGAQHAEIVIFVEPIVASTKTGYSFTNLQRDPGYLVADPSFFQDNEGDGVPDGYRLHYRTLLVRPDLNTNGILPNNGGLIFTAGPQQPIVLEGNSYPLPSPMCDLTTIHGVCDLSIRRNFDGNNGTRDSVSANSLEDLVDPANRFAHVQYPMGNSTTMPLLALGPGLPIHATSSPSGVGSGFLHPAFTLQGTRIGEDILASDILAFDIKGYDPGCSLLMSPGIDGVWGTNDSLLSVAGDDDNDGTANNASEAGWAGSDDLLLSPNDPGYSTALAQGAVAVGTGEYVDLGWAHKLRNHDTTLSYNASTPVWTQLSGYSLNNFITTPVAGFPFTDALYKSGMALQNGPYGNTPPMALQMAYDTWTTRYEGDGVLNAVNTNFFYHSPSSRSVGNLRINGNLELYGNGSNELGTALPAWRRTNIDAATDGIDNNGLGGVDDISEFETSAPFPIKLRGLKISIRMEDTGTRTVSQMSVAQEFVSQ